MLTDSQHGVRAKRSTETQLIQTIHDISKSLDKKETVDMAILDFTKAFDTLLASWYPTYMQHFIISHSSCAEQYGDMSSDTQTHSQTKNLVLIGSLGHHNNLTHFGIMVPDIHAKFHNQPFITHRAIWRHVFGHSDSLTHTQLNHQRLASI